MVRGLAEVAEQVFDAPTRTGFPDPSFFGGLADEVNGAQWATVCGLARYSMRSQLRGDGVGGRSSVRKVADWIGNFRDKFR
jgi:cell division ATPase FtsA